MDFHLVCTGNRIDFTRSLQQFDHGSNPDPFFEFALGSYPGDIRNARLEFGGSGGVKIGKMQSYELDMQVGEKVFRARFVDELTSSRYSEAKETGVDGERNSFGDFDDMPSVSFGSF